MDTNIKFTTPVRVNGKLLDSCTMRTSTMGDEEDSQALAVELGRPLVPLTSEMCLFAALTGISYEDIRTFSPANYDRLRLAYREGHAVRPTNPAKEPDASPAPQSAREHPHQDTMPPLP